MALAAWRIQCRGYKDRRDPTGGAAVRGRIAVELERALVSWLDLEAVKEACVESDHVLDGLICGLVTVAAKTASTHPPAAHQRGAAGREGWIHVPSPSPVDLKPVECAQTRDQ